jgi:hypothetical protein
MPRSDSTAESLVEEGLQHYRSGEIDQALSKWRSALILHPGLKSAVEYIDYVEGNRKALEQRFRIARSSGSHPSLHDVDGPVSTSRTLAKDSAPRRKPSETASMLVDDLLPPDWNDATLDGIGPLSEDGESSSSDFDDSPLTAAGFDEPDGGGLGDGRIELPDSLNLSPVPALAGEVELPDDDEITGQRLVSRRPVGSLEPENLPFGASVSLEEESTMKSLEDQDRHAAERVNTIDGVSPYQELFADESGEPASVSLPGGEDDFASEEPTPAVGEDQVDEMLDGAERMFAQRSYDGSLWFCQRVLALQPENAGALALQQKNRLALIDGYERSLGDLDLVPVVCIPKKEILWHRLDHRAGYVLSRMDGRQVTYGDLLDVSGMDRYETLRILVQLVDEGVIGSGSGS